MPAGWAKRLAQLHRRAVTVTLSRVGARPKSSAPGHGPQSADLLLPAEASADDLIRLVSEAAVELELAARPAVALYAQAAQVGPGALNLSGYGAAPGEWVELRGRVRLLDGQRVLFRTAEDRAPRGRRKGAGREAAQQQRLATVRARTSPSDAPALRPRGGLLRVRFAAEPRATLTHSCPLAPRRSAWRSRGRSRRRCSSSPTGRRTPSRRRRPVRPAVP